MIQGTYYNEWSTVLGREMEFKVYGHAGVPVLALPARGGRFYDWENNGMPDAIAQLLNEGKVQLFCADAMDGEGLLNGDLPQRRRAELQEKYFVYLTAELAPRILTLNNAKKGTRIWTAGVDLGAYHAVHCRLRRPTLFAGAVGMGGIYDLTRFWGTDSDDMVLRCAPLAYLQENGIANKPALAKAEENSLILCAGQGAYEGEALDDTLLCSRDDEVGDLARAFAGREQALREFLNREQLFTGDVSHELRTPLTVLQGGVEILESRLSGDDKLLPIVGRMQRTVASMTAMVGTMLLLARKPEQLEFRPFDLCVLARQEEVEIRERLRGRPVTFSSLLPDRLTVLGSPELAAMVLHNLLDNACRYTEQGRILLEFRAEEMLLTDTAPVIDPDVRTRMFERGVRGTSKSPGSGLGLSLVLRGCERLGWKVAHEHWEGGNRFRVRFSQG